MLLTASHTPLINLRGMGSQHNKDCGYNKEATGI